ncbi:MAG: hypothetical protein JO023_27375, partial [Chloroflexi bacterium]|nr:hypothetical protein [Chloroflexota bacterium]
MLKTGAQPDRSNSGDVLTGIGTSFLRLDLRLRLEVNATRERLIEHAKDPFRGLYIAEADVDELMASTPPVELARRLLDGEVADFPPRLQRLARLFGLS